MTETDYQLKEVISTERIKARVAELAGELSRDYKGRSPVLLGILKGAFIFLSDIARSMDTQVQIDFLRVCSYGSEQCSSGQIELKTEHEIDLAGRVVIVIEDIVDTGLTLAWLLDHLKCYNPAEIKLCTLIDKPERREIDLTPDYVGFTVPSGFLVGYGLDFDEDYRELPGIYELVPNS